MSPRCRNDVFRAFHLTPLDSARVVLLGEDPYPDPSQAHGLAFSLSSKAKAQRPISLTRILASLQRDTSLRFAPPSHGDLTAWARRGVLLLNVALTHKSGDSQPDVQTWGPFATAVLETVDAKRDPVAWLLWGDAANDYADSIPVGSAPHRRFENAHPRAGRAKRQLLGANPPFSAVSAFLHSSGGMDWSL